MPKMIVSIDGVVIKEVQLTKERTTLGRRPYNDIVIDNLAVSGEHAVLQMAGQSVTLEDLNSTNGTYVNGKAVKKQPLQSGDTIEVGKYKIRFIAELESSEYDKTVVMKPPMSESLSAVSPSMSVYQSPPSSTGDALAGSIKVLSGSAAGREVSLTKVVTTIGKPGVAVAAITRRPHGFVLAHVEGSTFPTLNGNAVNAEPVTLKSGDVLELAGTQMQFFQV